MFDLRPDAKTFDPGPVSKDISISLKQAFSALGVDFSSGHRLAETLPFSLKDTTVGSESELQTAVVGAPGSVDLPLTIQQSSFFSNVIKRCQTGETNPRTRTGIEAYLSDNENQVWENSWVRFKVDRLSGLARDVLETDLRENRGDPQSKPRSDQDRFLFKQNGESWLRVPVSYLLKLSLADFLGRTKNLDAACRSTGIKLLDHFLNDNTSPETHSFYVQFTKLNENCGSAAAREKSLRFLFTQTLVLYADQTFQLKENGQKTIVFFSPHAPVRQKRLNECIPDSFYRELFMSPCLSGWNRGEDKHAYMGLCHEVLSRSQLNTLNKLRESGILNNNLITLPNISNISLANNGTHVSLGSLRLGAALTDPASGFTEKHEKYVGDLVIKVYEHFLPLFVGLYSAAPYRLDFMDFHPEKALGFLAHELHYTHLRMIWRRWKKKARMKLFQKPITPFGPLWIDSTIRTLFGLHGDYVPDWRLLDYLVCLMSTENFPALNGVQGNQERLAKDLMHLGVFHEKMPLYLFCRQRIQSVMGFSGFESRFFSLFDSLKEDFAHAINLKQLILLMAFRLVATGRITHRSIPDTPFAESERRQVAFASAIGLPTFFIRGKSPNIFLKNLIRPAAGVRQSSRYSGYLRVHVAEFRRCCVDYLKKEASDLADLLGMNETLEDLSLRVKEPDMASAFGKLNHRILEATGVSHPFKLSAEDFNLAAEEVYREPLRQRYINEGMAALQQGFESGSPLSRFVQNNNPAFFRQSQGDRGGIRFQETLNQFNEGTLDPIRLEVLMKLLLWTFTYEREQSDQKTRFSITGSNSSVY
ncbi:MAG: hypothetical protein G3M70_04845 [Candidatus Nitronauta litoralis]|uniref:Uncharacterized protein n=1 Tax=Candidatus Nitronauta litoralis TaxID=2705533 RepID=A0A7T0FZ70_9BACT|nr:MAG: hypothetical protein G3M70_04845 [Candidatus Nitronauta litoralis]